MPDVTSTRKRNNRIRADKSWIKKGKSIFEENAINPLDVDPLGVGIPMSATTNAYTTIKTRPFVKERDSLFGYQDAVEELEKPKPFKQYVPPQELATNFFAKKNEMTPRNDDNIVNRSVNFAPMSMSMDDTVDPIEDEVTVNKVSVMKPSASTYNSPWYYNRCSETDYGKAINNSNDGGRFYKTCCKPSWKQNLSKTRKSRCTNIRNKYDLIEDALTNTYVSNKENRARLQNKLDDEWLAKNKPILDAQKQAMYDDNLEREFGIPTYNVGDVVSVGGRRRRKRQTKKRSKKRRSSRRNKRSTRKMYRRR